MIIEKFRKCGKTRDFYAHAKYSYGGGQSVSIIPFFGDTKKRSDGVSMTLDQVREDARFMQRTKYMIRDYIIHDVPPKR